jgi:hypothetical protein
MAELQTAITITAEDNASAQLKNIGEAAEESQSAVSKFGSMGSKALETFSQATTAIFATIEIFKSTRDAMLGFVEKSIEFRGENDKLVQSFRRQSDEVNALSARIGDVLLNAFIAVSEQFEPMIRGARDFLEANQQVLAIGLVEFFEKTALTMTNVVAPSIIAVTRTVAFFQMAWETLKTGVNATIGVILWGTSETLKSMSSLAQKVPFVSDEIKDGLSRASVAADEMSMAFLESADESVQATQDIANEQAVLEDKVRSVATTIRTQIGKVSKKAIKQLGKETKGLNTNLERTQARLDSIGAWFEEFTQKRKDEIDAAADLFEAEMRLRDELLTLEQQKRDEINEQKRSEHSETMGQIAMVGEAFAAAITEAESFSQAMGNSIRAIVTETVRAVIESIKTVIMARAVEAAVNAASASAAFGPLAMAGAGVAALSLVQGFIDKLPKFAQGGMVQGGSPGQDSVPILAMPGEYVMSTEQVDAMRQLFSNMDGVNTTGRFAGGGTVGGRSGGGVTVNISTAVPLSKAELTRYVRSSIVPALNDLRAQGVM